MKAYRETQILHDGITHYYYATVEEQVICVMHDTRINAFGIVAATTPMPDEEVVQIHYSEWLEAYEKAMQHIQNAVTNLHGLMVHGK